MKKIIYSNLDERANFISQYQCINIIDDFENKVVYHLEDNEIFQDGEVIIDPDYEAKQAQKERERLDILSLTAADVERAIYKVRGIDFDDILEMLKDNPGIDIKALKIELKANHFYRGNPYVNQIGNLLEFTEKQLDRFFETGDFSQLTIEE